MRELPSSRYALLAGVFAMVVLLTVAAPTLAGKFNKVLSIGDAAPEWKELAGLGGKRHSLADMKDAKAVVVVFTCNHCPVARGYEQRLIEFTTKHQDLGVAVVAISVSRRPEDGDEQVAARAKERGYNFSYLFDPTQNIGRRYGATNTSQFFVLGAADKDGERTIAYMGAFDDHHDAKFVEKPFLVEAVEAVLAGNKPPRGETRPRGCEIEYVEIAE